MAGTWPRLAVAHELAYIGHQTFHGWLLMISRDRVVQGFPQSLDFVDPRMINGLKEQLEFGVVGEPTLCDAAFVNHVVVNDEHDASGAATGALDFVQ
jgi:hypothetical protein